MTPTAVQIVSIVVMAFVGMGGSYTALTVFRRNDERRRAKAEKDQDITLAVLAEKVDAIPERMNGKILKAITKHQAMCKGTNPRMQAYDSEVG